MTDTLRYYESRKSPIYRFGYFFAFFLHASPLLSISISFSFFGATSEKEQTCIVALLSNSYLMWEAYFFFFFFFFFIFAPYQSVLTNSY